MAIEISSAWGTGDPERMRAVVAFWERLRVLPEGVDPESRAREVCAIARDGNGIAGVSTAYVSDIPALRSKFAFFRCLVAPEYRQRGIATGLCVASKKILSDWSRAHPELEVQGMAIVGQSPLLLRIARPPVEPQTGLSLVGYTSEGHQIRVVWFEHARIEA